ncbi:uncharacterized protein METZ01_LOCUS15671 [marine metagenome]|uniref:Uncharacterized protein n=1 Tax=marine metagenome TaxID=408172 RepID=A0A381P8X3_9ZZZZ
MVLPELQLSIELVPGLSLMTVEQLKLSLG